MKRTFTKYPSKYVKANIDDIENSRGACYIDNWSPYNKTYNVLENIMDMANRCLQGSVLSVPDVDSIGVADNGQLLGFYHLYKTRSGNWYSIGWQGGEWQLFIYDNVSAENLHWLADAMDEINNTFNGVRFHEDRPII